MKQKRGATYFYLPMSLKFTPINEIPSIVASVREAYNSHISHEYEWRIAQLKGLARCIEENEESVRPPGF